MTSSLVRKRTESEQAERTILLREPVRYETALYIAKWHQHTSIIEV